MLKLNGAWLCGLSSVPQGSGLSGLRSSHPRQVSIGDTYEQIVISGASLIGLEDAYWYSSERWYMYVLTDPFLNLHLLHRYYTYVQHLYAYILTDPFLNLHLSTYVQ